MTRVEKFYHLEVHVAPNNGLHKITVLNHKTGEVCQCNFKGTRKQMDERISDIIARMVSLVDPKPKKPYIEGQSTI